MKVALIHDWLTGMRGGEYVLEAIAELFPKADIFTLVSIPEKISESLKEHSIHTSWLQKFPDIERRYRHFLPLMPKAIESFDLKDYALILSSSHCVAKGIRKPAHSFHLSYVHAPMRYMWDRFDDYFGPQKTSLPVRLAAQTLRPRLQQWDRKVSQKENVDALIANSCFIAEQIERAYGRKASVVYPFADLRRFNRPRKSEDFYLMVGAFAPYKRVDLAIQATQEMNLPLKIIGSGQDEQKLRKLANSQTEFLGALSNHEIEDYLSRCKAFLFPGKEDFGITPLEALASGAPVVAFQEGGASETVTSETGVFFTPQNVESLKIALEKIESKAVEIDEHLCRQRAQHFTKERFQKEFLSELRRSWGEAHKDLAILESLLNS